MKEVFISFAIFVFCLSLAIFSQLNSPKAVNASQIDIQRDNEIIIKESTSSKNINLFELDPSDPNPQLFAMADESTSNQNGNNIRITQSGLIISDIFIGEGEEAISGKTVTVEYTGRLENGEQFDSSIGRAPFSFTLGEGRVIKGWDEGVQGMKVGGKRELTIPPELGYGSRGAGNVIPANATLIFEIELLKVS